MDWLLILAAAALTAGVYLFGRLLSKPEPKAEQPAAKKPARKKWVWEVSYNPEVWFCERCQKEYRLAAPPIAVPADWTVESWTYRLKIWECTRCRCWWDVYPVGWKTGDRWPPKGSWQ